MKWFKRQLKTYIGSKCCDCNKKLYGEKDVPEWNDLESASSHDVQIVCSRCGKKQYSWKGFYKSE